MTAVRAAALLVALAPWTASAAAVGPEVLAAVRAGDAPTVRRLIDQRRDVNAAEVDGTTALMWAVRNGDMPVASSLLKAGANVNAANRYGMSALALAVSAGNAAAVELLLKTAADPKLAESTLPDGQTLMMLAARAGNTTILDALIARGADPNAVERRDGTGAVVWAVLGDHASAVRTLLRAGANRDARSLVTAFPHTPPAVVGDKVEPDVSYVGQTVLPKGGWTPLMYAAREGALQSARVLTEAGADLDVTDPDGTSALVFAIINGHYDVAALLIEQGANLDLGDRTGMTPLYAAVDMHTLGSTFGRPDPPLTVIDGSVPIVQMLLEYGANPDAALKTRVLKRVYNAGDGRLAEGATPLMRAARSGDVGMMRTLLQYGANPALKQKNGSTTIMLAASLTTKGNYPDRGSEQSAIEGIRLCLARGVDINAVNATGDSALHLASASAAIVRFLAANGGRLDLKNQRGLTPLAAAMKARNGDPQVLAALRELSPPGADAAPASAPAEKAADTN
jgi:ankyrin repeat protein